MSMMQYLRAVAMVAGILASVAPAAAQKGASVQMTTTPNPLGLGQNRFEATVKDSSGRPVADADVMLSLVMPADPKTKHPEMRSEGKLNNLGKGKYNGLAMVTMAGTWHVTVTAVKNGATIGQMKATLQAHAVRPKPDRRAGP